MYSVKKVKDFNLDHVFDCGQCFRWEREDDGSYTGIAYGKPVNVNFVPDYDLDSDNGSIVIENFKQDNFDGFKARTASAYGKLIIENATEQDFYQTWYKYFDLSTDYSKIKDELISKDDIIGKAISCGQGIRILNQEKWETLISFIISQNSNIPRIKKSIESLCNNFGEYVGTFRERKYYNIPTAKRLAQLTVEDLEPCKLGYRARYIIETAKCVNNDECHTLNSLHNKSYKEAYDYLRGLCGVGPKVANCIMLFSMEKKDSFPIDIWVKRVMSKLYGISENDLKEMQRVSEEKFGQSGGIAQQYLFYYIRTIQSR